MKEFRVVFNFDKDNSETILFKAETKEAVFETVSTLSRWLQYEDKDRGLIRSNNLEKVTSVYISEYESPSITTF